LVLIDHNPSLIQKADWIIEMGPGAGEKGGEILFQGKAKDVLENPESPTGKWIRELSHRHPREGGDLLSNPRPNRLPDTPSPKGSAPKTPKHFCC
jgi:excinuclease ABC subunit A